MGAVAEAIAGGGMGGRLWLYSNYHCNLSCSYCLTESSPGVPRRALDATAILARAREARELGFTGVGITGGEPFLLAWMPALLAELAEILPVIVLSNATLFTGRRLAAVEPLAGLPVRIQIPLD
ncbi:MAG: radical SAM protein, partial [Solirubrobacteraceae bacterium]